jgi:hypothetical protein
MVIQLYFRCLLSQELFKFCYAAIDFLLNHFVYIKERSNISEQRGYLIVSFVFFDISDHVTCFLRLKLGGLYQFFDGPPEKILIREVFDICRILLE